MRNSAFWCCDSLVEPYVLWCYGLRWYDIEALRDKDGRLPLHRVGDLLRVLLDEEPTVPTPKQVVDVRIDPDEVLGWDRTFRHKRRNLVWLFQASLRLGEEVVYSMI
jgi:hypothetical protein